MGGKKAVIEAGQRRRLDWLGGGRLKRQPSHCLQDCRRRLRNTHALPVWQLHPALTTPIAPRIRPARMSAFPDLPHNPGVRGPQSALQVQTWVAVQSQSTLTHNPVAMQIQKKTKTTPFKRDNPPKNALREGVRTDATSVQAFHHGFLCRSPSPS